MSRNIAGASIIRNESRKKGMKLNITIVMRCFGRLKSLVCCFTTQHHLTRFHLVLDQPVPFINLDAIIFHINAHRLAQQLIESRLTSTRLFPTFSASTVHQSTPLKHKTAMSSVDTGINSIHLGGSGNNYITFHISRPASRVNSRPATPSVPMSAFVFPPEDFFHLPSPGEASRSQTPANASINPTSPDDVYNIAQATPVGDLFDHHFNTPEFLSEVGATLIAMETLINPKQ